jgi:hypothetical protein
LGSLQDSQGGSHRLFSFISQNWRAKPLVSLQVIISPRQAGAFILRRGRRGGDGTDHDPAWVILDL